MTASNSTPAELGYRWPAEWEPHAASWLSWPHNCDTWPGQFDKIPSQFAHFVETVARFEPVHVLAGGEAVWRMAEQFVGQLDNVTLHDIPTNDAWCRDHGPIFLQGSPPPSLIDWQYNAWGGKYPPFELDNAVPRRIAAELNYHCFSADLVLEGGSIDGNGRGTVLTTERCLLNRNRNPGWSRRAIEGKLRDYLGARCVLWLSGEGIQGDDTDGHIDQLARFVGPREVLAARCEDPDDANYGPLAANVKQLQSMHNESGEPLQVRALPMPRPLFCQGRRLPASYANFYIINRAVLVPVFDDPADDFACQVLEDCFPGRQVIPLPAADIVWGLGAYHCLSQQQPCPAAG